MSRFTKLFWAVLMAVIMTNVPNIALANGIANQNQEMISTMSVVEELSRAQAEAKVQSYISREDIRTALIQRGVNPDEVTARMASLSDRELRNLAMQMDQAMYGGDVGGILILVLIVVLIIFLVKRI